MIIQEDYVSFEIAKLLKEKGFEEMVSAYYNIDGAFRRLHKYSWANNSIDTEMFAAPTLQMVCKWLRQIHNIHITISLASDSYYKYEIYRLHSNYPIELKLSEEAEEYYNQYEQAVEAAIKYCLENLI